MNYGLQRHAGGGMAVRTIACLPAVTGHWRRAGGGVQLSSSGELSVQSREALAPGSLAAGAHDQHDPARRSAQRARCRRGRAAGARARRVQQQSRRGRAGPQRGRARARARGSVHRRARALSQTDTADWADIVLPATTQLEHWDVHYSYGHHYVTLNRPSIAPHRRVQAEQRDLPADRRAHGHRPSRDARRRSHAHSPGARLAAARSCSGVTLEALLEKGWMRLNVPTPYLPYAEGELSDAERQVRALLAAAGGDGARSRADVHAAVRVGRTARRSSRRAFRSTLISSPAHQFLNTTFVNVDSLRRSAREPELYCFIPTTPTRALAC